MDLKLLKQGKIIWCSHTSCELLISWVTQGSETYENENDEDEGRFANTSILVCGLRLQNPYRILCVVGKYLSEITLQFWRVHIKVKTSVCNMRTLMYQTKPQSQISPKCRLAKTLSVNNRILHVAYLSSAVSTPTRNANRGFLKPESLWTFSAYLASHTWKSVSISGFTIRCVRKENSFQKS